MDYERVCGRASLRGEDPCDGVGIECMCAESVDSFRGEGDETAFAEDVGGVSEGLRIGGEGVHADDGHRVGKDIVGRSPEVRVVARSVLQDGCLTSCAAGGKLAPGASAAGKAVAA